MNIFLLPHFVYKRLLIRVKTYFLELGHSINLILHPRAESTAGHTVQPSYYYSSSVKLIMDNKHTYVKERGLTHCTLLDTGTPTFLFNSAHGTPLDLGTLIPEVHINRCLFDMHFLCTQASCRNGHNTAW